MRRTLVFSTILHVFVGLVVGLWVCPWFERLALTPDVRGMVDIEYFEVGDLSRNGNGQKQKGKTIERRTPETVKAEVVVTGSQKSIPVDSPAVAQVGATTNAEADSVWIEGEGGDGSKMISVADYFKWVRTHNEMPQYPRLSRIRNEQGRVLVRVTISQRGSPPEVAELEKSSGYDLLDRVALEAARSWRYPAFRGSRQQLTMLIPYKFGLD